MIFIDAPSDYAYLGIKKAARVSSFFAVKPEAYFE